MLIIEANYSKKLGLPGYSSHQYSLTLRAEVSDVSQVSAKSQELHTLMQDCVDREIQQTGFLPGENNGNGHRNCHSNGNGNGRHAAKAENDKWVCSDKQKELILKITDENKLDKTPKQRASKKSIKSSLVKPSKKKKQAETTGKLRKTVVRPKSRSKAVE